jgi:hypothetical protein
MFYACSTTLAESGTASLESAAGAATLNQLIEINNNCGISQRRMMNSLTGVRSIAA